MAEIQVRANKLTGNVPHLKEPAHLVIVVTDDYGNHTFFRGGPGQDGLVRTDSGPYVNNSIDWNPEATIVFEETIPQSEVPQVLEQFQNQLDAIQDAQYTYAPIPSGRGDGNSNSTVGTLMRNVRNVDLDISNWATEVGNGITAPGEDVHLVDREGNRTIPRQRANNKLNYNDVRDHALRVVDNLDLTLAQQDTLVALSIGDPQQVANTLFQAPHVQNQTPNEALSYIEGRIQTADAIATGKNPVTLAALEGTTTPGQESAATVEQDILATV